MGLGLLAKRVISLRMNFLMLLLLGIVNIIIIIINEFHQS